MSQRTVRHNNHSSQGAICAIENADTLHSPSESATWTREKLLPTIDLHQPGVTIKKQLSTVTFPQRSPSINAHLLSTRSDHQRALKCSLRNHVVTPTMQRFSPRYLLPKATSTNLQHKIHRVPTPRSNFQKNYFNARLVALSKPRSTTLNAEKIFKEANAQREPTFSSTTRTQQQSTSFHTQPFFKKNDRETCVNENCLPTHTTPTITPKGQKQRITNPSQPVTSITISSSNRPHEVIRASEQRTSTSITSQRLSPFSTGRLPQPTAAINTQLSSNQLQSTTGSVATGVLSQRRVSASTGRHLEHTTTINTQLSSNQPQDQTCVSEQSNSPYLLHERRKSPSKCFQAQHTATTMAHLFPNAHQGTTGEASPRRKSFSTSHISQNTVSNNTLPYSKRSQTMAYVMQLPTTQTENTKSYNVQSSGLPYQTTSPDKQLTPTPIISQKPAFAQLLSTQPQRLECINGQSVSARNLRQRTSFADRSFYLTSSQPQSTGCINTLTSNTDHGAEFNKVKSEPTSNVSLRRVTVNERCQSTHRPQTSIDADSPLNRLQNTKGISFLKPNVSPRTSPFPRHPRTSNTRSSVALQTVASKYSCRTGPNAESVATGSVCHGRASFNMKSPKIRNIRPRAVSRITQPSSHPSQNAVGTNTQLVPMSSFPRLRSSIYRQGSPTRNQVERGTTNAAIVHQDTSSPEAQFVSLRKLSETTGSQYHHNNPIRALHRHEDGITPRIPSQSVSSSALCRVPEYKIPRPSSSSLELREDVIKTLPYLRRRTKKLFYNAQPIYSWRSPARSVSPKTQVSSVSYPIEQPNFAKLCSSLCHPETAVNTKVDSRLPSSLPPRIPSPQKISPNTSTLVQRAQQLQRYFPIRPGRLQMNTLSASSRMRPRTPFPRKLRPTTCSHVQRAGLTRKLYSAIRPISTISSKEKIASMSSIVSKKSCASNQDHPTYRGAQCTPLSRQRPTSRGMQLEPYLNMQRPSTCNVPQRTNSLSKVRPSTSNFSKSRTSNTKHRLLTGNGSKCPIAITKQRPLTSSVCQRSILDTVKRPSTCCIGRLQTPLNTRRCSTTKFISPEYNRSQLSSNLSKDIQNLKAKPGTQRGHFTNNNCLSWEYPSQQMLKRRSISFRRPFSKRHQSTVKTSSRARRHPPEPVTAVQMKLSAGRLHGVRSVNASCERGSCVRIPKLNSQRLGSGKLTSSNVQPLSKRSQSEHATKNSVQSGSQCRLLKRSNSIDGEPAFMRNLRLRACRLKAELVSLRRLCEKVAGIIDKDLNPTCVQ